MKRILLLIYISTSFLTLSAQYKNPIRKLYVTPPVCYASDEVHRVFIPPSKEMLNQLKSASENKSDIIVNYSLFPSEAKQAMEYAVSLWELIIESSVPIYLQANWRAKGENVLGSCAPSNYYSNFEGAPRADLFYPVSIAEKITKKEITGPSTPDINADFNKDINWYFGIDGNTPDSLYDFVTVALHEIGHGLGFTGFFYILDDEGAYGFYNDGDATIFDQLVIDKNGKQLLDTAFFPYPSNILEGALTSNELYAFSPVAIMDNDDKNPRLYAPTTWSDGSSIYHLNDNTYLPEISNNALMTHAIGKGEAVHDPGPITKGIMADIGWKNIYLDFVPVKDVEISGPLTFSVKIESDFELDTTSLFVFLSTDSFQTSSDTLVLEPSVDATGFITEYQPEIESGTIYYYLTASDKKNRLFTAPGNAPKTVYTINIGPDNEKPVIDHTPISFFLMNGDDLKILAMVDDNLGIDSVFVRYDINGVEQVPFELAPDSGTIYSGNFSFDKNLLKDGDVISYDIKAIDASVGQNTATIPFKTRFSFKVEGLFSPVIKYNNEFNSETNDFIISDFEIYTSSGLENGALQSSHPYPSPNEDNTEFNFTTILKYPIILQDGGGISYDEIVLVEPGENLSEYGDFDFWDYVIVEGSKDKGDNWLPLIDGYDSGANTLWKTNFNQNVVGQESKTEGTADMFINRSFQLLGNGNFNVGDTILIRFRLFSDPYANGWGWAIDNLRIQIPTSSQLSLLSPGNIMVFPNPFDDYFTVSIQLENGVEDIQLDVFNMYGQKIESKWLPNVVGIAREEIRLNNAESGIYLITIREKGELILSKKIVKN